MSARPIVNLRGHRWYLSNNSSLGSGYFRLERVSFVADLKRYGSVATVIDVAKEELKQR